MKTYAYLVTERPHDRNGNPRNLVTVYRIKGNRPQALLTTDIGYRAAYQAAYEALLDKGELTGKYKEKGSDGWYAVMHRVVRGEDSGVRLVQL